MSTLDGFVYAVGGYDGATRIDSVERYNPRSSSWEFVQPLPMPISRCHATSFNGCLYVAGNIYKLLIRDIFSLKRNCRTDEGYNDTTDVLHEKNQRSQCWTLYSSTTMSSSPACVFNGTQN